MVSKQKNATLGLLEKPGFTWVVVSSKCARQIFEGCSLDYIKNVCHARCCVSRSMSMRKIHTTVSIQDDQREILAKRGAKFVPRLSLHVMQPGSDGLCVFWDQKTFLCPLHHEVYNGIPVKPRSCFISPWTLTANHKLIVRNRYRRLRCYNVEGGVFAYVAFRKGLELIFGLEETDRIVKHLEDGGGDIGAWVSDEMVLFLSDIKAVWNVDK